MTYSHIIDVPAPIEFYDVSHAAIREIAGPDGVDGLLVHVGRATDAGFEIVEVWEGHGHDSGRCRHGGTTSSGVRTSWSEHRWQGRSLRLKLAEVTVSVKPGL